MKKNTHQTKLSKSLFLLLGSLCIYSTSGLAADGRLSVRGLLGSESFADVDALLPLYTGCNNLWYVDGQAKYAKEQDWFAGLGLGYRTLHYSTIWGGDLFIDRAQSRHVEDHQKHHSYWILSPGLETIHSCWDIRVNGYFPINHRRNNEGSFFPSGLNESGINGDTSFIEFSGHQQFEHRFLRFEEVGAGGDAALGIKVPYLNCADLRGGVYYYHLQDTRNIRGVAARFDLPLTSQWAVTSEVSYDNQIHGAVAVGLRLQLGHTPKQGCCPSLCDRLYDPVYRYVGSTRRGSGIPIVRKRKDEGLFLRRDNIYFFSETGTATITSANAGTFENPFAPNQFTQTTLDAIATQVPNANLYFNTGNYTVNPGGLGAITLPENQSMFGRTTDFRGSAIAAQRPQFTQGEIDLFASNHTLDSIILNNAIAETGTFSGIVVGLDIEDANNVTISNSHIEADANTSGVNTGTNVALGIRANNSSVLINRSDIIGQAQVGSNMGINAASGIGNYNRGFMNNHFVILDSNVAGTALVLGSNGAINPTTDIAAINQAAGIGNNLATINLIAIDVLAVGNFGNNNFTLQNSMVTGAATVQGDNTAVSNTPDTFVAAINQATGVGNNNAIFTNMIALSATGNALFEGNDFSVYNGTIEGTATVRNNVAASTNASTSSIQASNQASGIGNNTVATNLSFAGTNFAGNEFNFYGESLISGNARVVENNAFTTIVSNAILAGVDNQAAGIGNNSELVAAIESASLTSEFIGNEFKFYDESVITGVATVEGDNVATNLATTSNQATGIGNNGSANTIVSTFANNFVKNDFTLCESTVIGIANVEGSNSAFLNGLQGAVFNQAVGIGNNGNIVGVIFSSLQQKLQQPIIVGLAANFEGNNFNLFETDVMGAALIAGNNNATITATTASLNIMASNQGAGIGNNIAVLTNGLAAADFNNNFVLSDDTVQGIAKVGMNNSSTTITAFASAFNQAVGMGNNVADISAVIDTANFVSSNLNICKTSITADAEVAGSSIAAPVTTTATTFNQATGIGNNVAASNPTDLVSTFQNNSLEIQCSNIEADAIVRGDNNGINSALGVNASDSANVIDISKSLVNVLASVAGNNTGTNEAVGLSALGTGSIINVFHSIVNVAALANAPVNSAIGKEGSVVVEDTKFNVVANP